MQEELGSLVALLPLRRGDKMALEVKIIYIKEEERNLTSFLTALNPMPTPDMASLESMPLEGLFPRCPGVINAAQLAAGT
ncbi:hypothetical protein E4U43_002781 [Claviceps pusilla]|uniref:Uncharacterized protein n=1 Tax=Claviceps pusilla TaxID=123648 RepID=A0A9P7NI68_9HYPO|nr:hypothetical protein E4U43_002781 [Claviceps pusilla]